ncbi:MAG: FAD-dependent oxidoreductase [Pseudomonadota bacterium]
MTKRVAVIGGGVIGVSVAWHLADRGGFDVCVYERDQISSGTTWHSAGNITRWPEPGDEKTSEYMFDIIPRLEKETGQETGWTTPGRLHLASSAKGFEDIKKFAADAARLGYPGRIIPLDELESMHPLISSENVFGAWFNDQSGRVNPTDLTNAYAKGARSKGVKIRERVSIERIETEGSQVKGIQTSEGFFEADYVVVCAGLWSRELLKPFDIHLGMSALEHCYLIADTETPLTRDTPSFECEELAVYGREEVGYFLVGFFDDYANVVDVKALPEIFSFALLPDNLDQIAPYYENAMKLFPALQEAPIRNIINGPESFTIDAAPIVGGFESIGGLYVACGMNSGGVSYSGMAGHHIADLLTGASPRFSEIDMSPERFDEKVKDHAWLDTQVSRVVHGIFAD